MVGRESAHLSEQGMVARRYALLLEHGMEHLEKKTLQRQRLHQEHKHPNKEQNQR